MVMLPPATGGFPAPTGLFPAGAAQSDPLFGVNPYSSSNMYSPGSPFGTGIDPSVGLPDLQTRRAAQMRSIQMAQLQSMGVPTPDTDPGGWTPEEATEQTDNAIFKIASVNPELAEELAAKRTPGEDDGDGFFSSLLHVAGEILQPALSAGGKLLELVGRTANIVPNLAFDAVNGGDFNFGEAVGGALSGKVRHNWNSVFQEMGWEGGGIGGFLRAGLGLAGDIATDPLTWVIPVGAGVRGAEAAAGLGKTAATRSVSILERAKSVWPTLGDEALGAKLAGSWDELVKGRTLGKFTHNEAEEVIAGLTGSAVKTAETSLLADMFAIGDKTYRLSRARGLATFIKNGGSVTLSDGSAIAGKELRGTIEAAIKQGNFTGKAIGSASGEWKFSRQLASSLGGTRFKAQLPFTNLRYISPAIPGSKFVSEKTLGFVTRAVAGQSGMNRLVASIGAGKGDWTDLERWMSGGFDAALEANPNLVKGIRGRFKNLGSMFYSASEQMGRITSHFDSGAKASRAGLMGYHAHAQSLEAQAGYNRMARELAYRVKGPDGKVMDRQAVLRAIESTLGVSFRNKGNVATPEQLSDYARVLDWFPPSLDLGDSAALDAWFWSQPKHSMPKGVGERGEALAGHAPDAEQKLARMHEVLGRLDPAQKQTLRHMSAIWDHVRKEAAKGDAVMMDVRSNFEKTGVIHTSQADEWALGTHEALQQDFFMDVADAERAGRVPYSGIDEADVLDGELVTGVHATRAAGGEAGTTAAGNQVRVRIRAADVHVIDDRAEAALSDEVTILEAREAAEAAVAGTKTAVAAATPGNESIASAVGAVQQARTTTAMATAELQSRYPTKQGVLRIHANGDMEYTAFNHADMKVVSSNAAHVVQEESGFFHRVLTKQTKEWLRGKIPANEREFLVAVPHLEAYLRRATVGMDIDDAEAFMREYLSSKFGRENLPDQLWNLNPLEVHEDYVSYAAAAQRSEMLGKAAARFQVLGELQPAMFGGTPQGAKWEWVMNPALLKSVAMQDTKLARAVLAANQRSATLLDEQQRKLADDAENYGGFAAMVEDALANGTAVPSEFVAAVRKHGATVSEASTRIDKELAGNRETQSLLRAHAASYEQAKLSLSGDPVYGHPGPGEAVRVTVLPDGRKRIQGWRSDPSGEMVGSMPDDAAELSNNGLYFGTYEQAKARVDTYAGAAGKTVGSRADESTWPTTKLVGDIEMTADELGGPIHPDMYYEDFIHPVEATGTFGDVLPEDAIGTFSGSPAGPSAAKVADRQAHKGETGIVYQNAPESGAAADATGESVVIFNPDDLTLSNGAARFEEDVAAGKLYRQADGTVSAKRSAGSRRLVPHADAAEQMDRLAGREAELSNLKRGIERGDLRADRSTMTADELLAADNAAPSADLLAREAAPARPPGTMTPDELSKYLDPNMVRRARKDGRFGLKSAEEFQALVDDIRLHGVRTPIVIDVHAGKGLLGDGYHRLAAAEAAGVGDIPVKFNRVDAAGATDVAIEGRARELLTGRRTPIEAAVGRVGEAGEAAARTGTAVAERLGKQQLAAGKKLERLSRQTHLAMAEANKTYAEMHGAIAAVQPALVKAPLAGNLGDLTRLRVPGLEDYAMPAYIAEEFHHAIDQFGATGLQKAWREYVMGPWKRWATYRWPGFHVRNFFGAFFNNWLGGVGLPDYVFSWRVNHARDGALKWAERKVSDAELRRYHLTSVFGKGVNPTYADVADVVAKQGVGRANTMAVMGIGTSTEATREVYRVVGHKNPSVVRRAARKFDETLREVGSTVEDFHRVAAWGTGMAATQGDTYGARAFVMMRHGDYSDLTGAEQYVKDVVPFYKWMRTNTPYQLRMLAENPTGLTNVHDKLKRAVYDAQGIDFEEAQLQMPDYAKQTFSIPIPSWVPVVGSKDKDALKFAMFDLPYADLYNGLTDYMSSTLPVVRNVLESYGFKQTLFSGVPLTGKYKPLSGVFNIPGVRDILNKVGVTKTGADGVQYIDDKLQNVLMAWPVFSRFRNFTESDPGRVDARAGGLFSMIAGVGIKQGSYTDAELDFFYNEVQPLLDQYKSLGIKLPTMDDLQSGSVGAASGLTNADKDTQSPLFGALS